jgi:hypothetical protein
LDFPSEKVSLLSGPPLITDVAYRFDRKSRQGRQRYNGNFNSDDGAKYAIGWAGGDCYWEWAGDWAGYCPAIC